MAEIDTNVIYCGDNMERLGQLPAESVDLIYPPFFSNRDYEVIWGDEAEVRSFEDRWEGGMQHYIEWMRQRSMQLHRVMKPTATLYLHCDPSASHYLKVMLDGLFGGESFLSEVVWKRTSAHSSAKRYGPVHDTLLVYAKSGAYTWNRTYQPYDPVYVETFFDQTDGDGRRWKRNDLTGAGTRNGETGLPWRGIDVTSKGRHWAHPPDRLDELNAEGRIHWPAKPGGMPRLKQYPEDSPGVPLQDIWTDIRPMHNLSRERLGYPTQKPEALLERILTASSNPGDIVLDPFCGCGTTVAVAERMRRRWIGIDISPTAARIMRRRLNYQGAYDFSIVGLPENADDLRNLKPFEFQNWIIDAVHGVHAPRKVGDMGIDGYSFFERLPIQVKQSDRVGRHVIDGFETAVRREGKHKGFVIAFSFTRGAHEEAARVKQDGLDIGLVTVSSLLDNPVEEPLRRGLSEMTAELLELARRAAKRGVVTAAPPSRSAAELVASDQTA